MFLGNDNGTFYAIDRTSGDLVWSFATESPNLPSSPVIANELVIFGSFDGGLYGLDIDNGEVRWRYAHHPTSPRADGSGMADAIHSIHAWMEGPVVDTWEPGGFATWIADQAW